VSSFNQAAFRDALATQMGVSPSAIMLAVTAASVAVTATISYPTPAAAVAAATTLAATPASTLSAALGIYVQAVGNVALTLVAPPPSPPPPSPPSRPTFAQSLLDFGGRWTPKTTLQMAIVDQTPKTTLEPLEGLYPFALLSLVASLLVLSFFCCKEGGRHAFKDTPLLPPSAQRSGLRSRAVLSTTLRRRLTSFMDLPSDARLPIGKAQEVITRSPCVHQTTSDSRLPWTTTTPSSLPSGCQPSASQMPLGAPFPSPVWAAAPPAPPPRSPRTSSGFTPHLLPHATVSSASASAAMAMAQAASEHARQAVERADTASIQAAVREAETAALALMMTVQDAGERSPGRGPLPEPPPMLQDRASPAARMDANGKGSSLIGDARIEGDDDDDNDEHAPMRPRHASARAAVPAAVQPAALTRPTALQLQHERELAYGAGALEAYGAGARAYGAPLNLSAALDSVAANMKGRADPTGYLREETRSPIASRGRAKKAKKALVGTTSSASGKGLHGCASAAGASPCRSPLATVAEQAEEPSLAEESSASLVASEEQQQQEASSPSPSQTQRQLTLVKPRTVAAEAARVAAGCGMATPLSWLGFELVQSAPGIVAVAEVAAGSAAEEAGLCVGERLYALDGKRVHTTAEAAILLDDLSGAISMIVSPLTSWQPMRPPVPPDVPLCKQSWPTTPIADGVDVHKNTSIAIDPSRIDVHNAAANLQRVRSTKAHAAAAPPVPSVSSGLKRTSEADPTALATSLEGDTTRRQHIGAGGEPSSVATSSSTSTAAPAPSSSSSSSSRSVFPATWLPWSRAEASRGEKRGPKPSLVVAVSSASSASVQLSRGSKPSSVVAHANADLRPQSPPMSTAESPPPPEMEPAWLVDAIVPVEHTRSSAVPVEHTRSSAVPVEHTRSSAVPVEHTRSSADAPASALSSRAAEMLDEQTEESITTTVDGWVYNHAPGERWTEAELAEQAGELDETDEAELAELAAPKVKPKEAAVTPADRKAEAATAAPRGAAARVERTMTSVVVAEARAAVQEELETTLHQAATFGAVAARGGPASEAPGTTEIAYEWLGREEAKVDSTTPSPPLLGRRPSTPVAE
jgi:hypothetical protein